MPSAGYHPWVASSLLIGLVRLYQMLLRPILPRACRYHPTCSQYAIEAILLHGAPRGSWLAFKRVCRCHPIAFLGGGSGVDPVPGSSVSHPPK